MISWFDDTPAPSKPTPREKPDYPTNVPVEKFLEAYPNFIDTGTPRTDMFDSLGPYRAFRYFSQRFWAGHLQKATDASTLTGWEYLVHRNVALEAGWSTATSDYPNGHLSLAFWAGNVRNFHTGRNPHTAFRAMVDSLCLVDENYKRVRRCWFTCIVQNGAGQLRRLDLRFYPDTQAYGDAVNAWQLWQESGNAEL